MCEVWAIYDIVKRSDNLPSITLIGKDGVYLRVYSEHGIATRMETNTHIIEFSGGSRITIFPLLTLLKNNSQNQKIITIDSNYRKISALDNSVIYEWLDDTHYKITHASGKIEWHKHLINDIPSEKLWFEVPSFDFGPLHNEMKHNPDDDAWYLEPAIIDPDGMCHYYVNGKKVRSNWIP
jgi:hypothetical protein